MIVSAEIPDDVVKAVDVRVAKERLAAAENGKTDTPIGPSRSSFIKEAVQHFLTCKSKK
jgi:hypothetical protein